MDEIAVALRELKEVVFIAAMLVAVLIVLVLIFCQFLCFVWMPFGGITCALLARKRNLNVWKYGLVGTVYSAALFMPWIYLMRRLRIERQPSEEMVFDYDPLLIIWLIWIVANVVPLVLLIPMGGHITFFKHDFLFWTVNGLILLYGALAWIVSWRNAAKWKVAERQDAGDRPVNDLPKAIHLLPFAYFSAHIVATALMIFFLIF